MASPARLTFAESPRAVTVTRSVPMTGLQLVSLLAFLLFLGIGGFHTVHAL